MFDTTLLLAHGHIADLLAEADRERRADLVRSAAAPTGRSRTAVVPGSNPGSNPIRWIVRVLRATPRRTAT